MGLLKFPGLLNVSSGWAQVGITNVENPHLEAVPSIIRNVRRNSSNASATIGGVGGLAEVSWFAECG